MTFEFLGDAVEFTGCTCVNARVRQDFDRLESGGFMTVHSKSQLFSHNFVEPEMERILTPRLISSYQSSTLATLITSKKPVHLNMESRKRPHSLEEEPTIQKKRILTGVNGSPHVNGVVSDADEPRDADNLEVNAAQSTF